MSETLQDQANDDDKPIIEVETSDERPSEDEVLAPNAIDSHVQNDIANEGDDRKPELTTEEAEPMVNASGRTVLNGSHSLSQDLDTASHKETKTLLNGTMQDPPSKSRVQSDVDPEAQAMVIASLRSQEQDLFSQVTQLNNKLVQSYDRVSNLEDDLHVASSNLRTCSLKISQLELERTQHLAALNTGLLVERTQVTAELTRLMERATDEAARRGQAESARADIEKDLDDLSASLFHQANSMVAEARLARAVSERKVEEAEAALKGAEEVVMMMQQQMQNLQAEKEHAQKSVEEMQVVMGKGKWVERETDSAPVHPSLRLLSSHTPYQEFLLFVAHLRSIRPASQSPPAMSSLLPLPFISRLVAEDSDPTVRFDLAPSLNWLSRRSVLSALHAGQLTIEPISAHTLLHEVSFPSPSLSGTTSNATISCALCGTCIIPSHSDTSHLHPRPPTHPRSPSSFSKSNGAHSNSWSSFLSKNALMAATASMPLSRDLTVNSHSDPALLPPQIYVFRLSAPPASSLPIPLTPPQSSLQIASRNSTVYPLCRSGWCLARLRTTCSLWAFVKSGVVDKVWEEEVPGANVPQGEGGWEIVGGKEVNGKNLDGKMSEKPPMPPRRRGLWERASSIASTALRRDSSRERENEKERDGEKEMETGAEREKEKKLPAPPPAHPSSSRSANLSAPPPLPKRSVGRDRSKSPLPPTPTPEDQTISDVNGTHETVGVDGEDRQPISDGQRNEEPVSNLQSTEAEKGDSAVPSATDNVVSDSQVGAPSLSLRSLSEPTSDETFTTPTEELSSLETHHTSIPSSDRIEAVSDPETTPDTPKPPTPELKPNATDSTAPVPAVSNLQDDAKETLPLRTSSPAPPPLPRRAAARARPLSVAVDVAVDETATTVSLARDGKEEATSDTSARASTEEVPPISELAEPAVGESAEKEKTSAEATSSDSESAEPTIVETPAEEKPNEVLSIPEAESKKEDTSTQELPQAEIPSAADGPVANEVDQPEAQSDSKSIVDSKPTLPEVKGAEAVSDGDREMDVFVGDATWEERTWKEITRLKEDMFWARIGCLR